MTTINSATVLMATWIVLMSPVQAQDSNAGSLLTSISNKEESVNWFLSDGAIFVDVKVLKTIQGWANIEYTTTIMPPRQPKERIDDSKKTIIVTKIERNRCWVNMDQVTRIVPKLTPPQINEEGEQVGDGDAE